jgi:hypothetical protein
VLVALVAVPRSAIARITTVLLALIAVFDALLRKSANIDNWIFLADRVLSIAIQTRAKRKV